MPRGNQLILVGCVKGKRPGSWPARELYQSTLFAGRRRYAERKRCPWFILSAKYGFVHPDQKISWYEATLKSMSAAARREWSEQVLQQIDAAIGKMQDTVVEVHAGKEYRDFGLVDGLKRRGAKVELPVAHLGLGQQLAWYKA